MSAAKPRFAVELKEGRGPASFWADDHAVLLTDKDPRYETDSPQTHARLLKLPFLADATAKKAKGDS